MVVPRRSVIGWAIIAAVVGLSGVGRAKVVEQKRKRQRNAKAYALGLRRELSAKKQDWQQDNQQLFHGEHPSGELAELAIRGIQMQRPIKNLARWRPRRLPLPSAVFRSADRVARSSCSLSSRVGASARLDRSAQNGVTQLRNFNSSEAAPQTGEI